jgi:hypothetical protein
LAWFVAILAILFLAAGAALAYVVGAAAVLAFIATDNIRSKGGFKVHRENRYPVRLKPYGNRRGGMLCLCRFVGTMTPADRKARDGIRCHRHFFFAADQSDFFKKHLKEAMTCEQQKTCSPYLSF